MKKLIIITSIFIITYGCNKQPSAEFETDKTTYTGGEVVVLTNKSEKGKSYKWTMPDGQTSTSENVNFTLDESEPDGTLTFKLQVLSRKGNKTSEAAKSISVQAAKGGVVFWQAPSCGCGITTVTINGTTGQITSNYNSAPGCGASGVATFQLKVGTYNFTATDGTYTWSGSVTITKNGCLKQQLS